MTHSPHDEPRTSAMAMTALALLIPVPTLAVLAAMVFEPTRGTLLGQGLYVFGKIWVAAFPLAWIVLAERRRVSWSPMRHGGWLFGVISGIVIGAMILIAGTMIGDHIIDREAQRDAVAANGLDSPVRYILLAAWLSLVNALIEEYVWRWFVFRQCERLIGSRLAVVAAAMLFTVHHVVALKAQMDWLPTVLGSVGVFAGGLIWSWSYWRYQSIWSGYISHVIVDIAVFAVGWRLIFG